MRIFVQNTEITARLWIFDKDGTLISLDGWRKIMEKRIKIIEEKYGHSAAEIVKPVLGFKNGRFNIKDILYTTRDETSRECARLLKRPQEEILELFKLADNVLKDNVFAPIQGAKRVTSALFKKNKVAVLTNDLEKRTVTILNSLDIPFHRVVGSDTFPFYKPDPRLVFEIMREFGIEDPKMVVVVGDSKHDIDTAKRAGAMSIGVLSGVEDEEGLKEADFIINSINDIEIKEV